MIFAAIVASALVAPQRIDKVELKRIGGSPSGVFYVQGTTSAPETVFLNGKSTGVVMPGYYAMAIDGHNAAGRVIGTFFASPFWDTHPVGFTTSGQKLVLLPFLPSHIDNGGRVVGTRQDYRDAMVAEQDPYRPEIQRHAWAWQDGESNDLGLGHDVRFAKDGTIQGFFVCDQYGRPIDEVSGKQLYGNLVQLRFRWFSCQEGKRRNDTTLRTAVPFRDANYSGWLAPD
jgi:hypothetical protein